MQTAAHESNSSAHSGMSKDASDRALLDLFLLYHDEGALERLVRRHRQELLMTAYSYVPEIDIESAEELLREVYSRLAEDPRWLEGSISVAAGLRMLLLNVAHDRRLQEKTAEDDGTAQAVPRPDSGRNPAFSLKSMIETALEQIPERPRAVLSLRYQEGLSIPDAAKALKRPLAEVRDDFLIGILLLRSELHRKEWRMSTSHLLDLLEQTYPIKHESLNIKWVLEIAGLLIGGCALVWLLAVWGVLAFRQ